MRRPDVVWASALSALAVLDLWADLNTVTGDTLSEQTRAAFRTDTTRGRLIFIGTWLGLSAWLVPHICRTTRLKET